MPRARKKTLDPAPSSDMASKTKFYAVKKGHVPGIYTTWADCSNQVQFFCVCNSPDVVVANVPCQDGLKEGRKEGKEAPGILSKFWSNSIAMANFGVCSISVESCVSAPGVLLAQFYVEWNAICGDWE